MSKNFSKTMTLESFKEMASNTPEMKIKTFMDVSKEYENYGNKVKVSRGDILNLFLNKTDRFLFVYENLSSFNDFTPSEVVNIMKSTNYWDIHKVAGENSIVIKFADGDNYFITTPISVETFVEFLKN
jgi:hypothetical protein